MQGERGFTLIELLVAMVLFGIFVTLGASALRVYWLKQALNGGRGEVISQLRQAQQQSVSESHPLVYGVRFDVGESTWGTVRYNPGANLTSYIDDVCKKQQSLEFGFGVEVQSASFAAPSGLDPSKCGTGAFAFFYARGSATEGSVTLVREGIGSRKISVSPLTGRVKEVTP